MDAAWDQMTTTGAQGSPTVKEPPHDLLSITATAPDVGYAYVFVSNEHPTWVDVYFDDVTVSTTPSPIVSASDYFPYGLGYNQMDRSGSQQQRTLYNGKELQDELSLNWYDYGARMYMPELGRWGVVDPMAEVTYSWSVYHYAFNNPVKYIDPNGMMSDTFMESDVNWGFASLVYCNECGFTSYQTEESSASGVSERAKTMAKLSDDVYRTSNGRYVEGESATDLDGWKLSEKDFGITLTDDKSGFNSAVYEKEGEYVYVTQGSDFDNGGVDWKENAKQAFGEVSRQYKQSTENARTLAGKLGSRLSFAGHSLGGGLASANALKTGLRATTFNASGLHRNSWPLYGLGNSAQIDAYRVAGEIVGASQALIGLKAEGTMHMLPSRLPYAPTLIPVPQLRTAAVIYNFGLSTYNHTMMAVMDSMGIE